MQQLFILFIFTLTTSYIIPSSLALSETEIIENSKHTLKMRVTAANRQFEKYSSTRQNSPSFWGEQVIYQIQVDRFNNGDFSNDTLNLPPSQVGDDLRKLPDYRHGGDLQGIIDRLEYLKDLGITTLWLTPVFEHDGEYHGYCTTNFSKIDAGLGNKEKLRELVTRAHRLNMYVVLDVVANHMCDRKSFYIKKPQHQQCAQSLFEKSWNGDTSSNQHQGTLKLSENFFSHLKNQNFFNRCGPNSLSEMQGTGPASEYGDFVEGMFDFDTRNYDFQEIFTELQKFWISYADIDGIRLDAAKHISEDFIAYFSTNIRHHAQALGKKNFFVIGEVAAPSSWMARRLGNMQTNPLNAHDHGKVPQSLTNRLEELSPLYQRNPIAPYPGLNAVYDFAHGGIALDVLFSPSPTIRLENYFKSPYRKDLSAQNDTRLNWNLLEIHDWPRLASIRPNSMEHSRLGLSYLALAEGSPIVYYGMEQGLNGHCPEESRIDNGKGKKLLLAHCSSAPREDHAFFRQDMFVSGRFKLGSTVPEIKKLSGISNRKLHKSFHWQNDPFLNRDHDLFKTTRKLLNLRNNCSALRFGNTLFRWTEQKSGDLLAFSRVYKNQEMLIIFNKGPYQFSLPPLLVEKAAPGDTWVNILNPQEKAIVQGNGKLDMKHLNILPFSTLIMLPFKNLGNYSPKSEVHYCAD
jgi:glycosidase